MQGAKCIGGELLGTKRSGRNVPGTKSRRGEVTRGRTAGGETLGVKCWGRNIRKPKIRSSENNFFDTTKMSTFKKVTIFSNVKSQYFSLIIIEILHFINWEKFILFFSYAFLSWMYLKRRDRRFERIFQFVKISSLITNLQIPHRIFLQFFISVPTFCAPGR